ncbi:MULTISPECIES: hypothetical protein [Bacillaceae]|uniref:Uncharacterized protein n=1 Tax=Evansella alkalicola TaxID=745819 RepID=A0ABS6JYC0_9BACI|nr:MULTISPECIES: hypothetical protein [Bacillaceae]MBU9722100.1 hypothetical protein [Bacillus alkalicola]
MLLTKKDKQILIRILKREKRRKFGLKENKDDIQQLLDKFEQSYRNEKVNKVKYTKL